VLLFQLGFQLTRHISLFMPNLHVLILQVRVEAKKQSESDGILQVHNRLELRMRSNSNWMAFYTCANMSDNICGKYDKGYS
jgi:hypothetical protein